ncbi:hypothetical protein D9C73_022907 [Collichthys lucidus]|uniref:Uncharacterized protein n=1 Tax=Collichthys lucidus TaxID=240159 RepID=A0A4V6ASK3_COLLU|nr:hypothetical protein D9C73_022907 [Collichthys lucidus]
MLTNSSVCFSVFLQMFWFNGPPTALTFSLTAFIALVSSISRKLCSTSLPAQHQMDISLWRGPKQSGNGVKAPGSGIPVHGPSVTQSDTANWLEGTSRSNYSSAPKLRTEDGDRKVLTGAYGREGHAGSVFSALPAATGSSWKECCKHSFRRSPVELIVWEVHHYSIRVHPSSTTRGLCLESGRVLLALKPLILEEPIRTQDPGTHPEEWIVLHFSSRRNLSDWRVYTSVQALMAESVTERLKLVFNVHCPVAGNGRLIAGYRSISDRSYRMVSLGYVSQDLAHVWAVLIHRLQIYGYVSSICTKAKTLLSLLASVIDFLQMWLRQCKASALSVPPRSQRVEPSPFVTT